MAESAGIFRSSRLEYRSIRAGDANQMSFVGGILGDSTLRATHLTMLPLPLEQADHPRLIKSMIDLAMLAVIIYLPSHTPSSPGSAAVSDYEERPIGVLTLGDLPAEMLHHRSSDMIVVVVQCYRNMGYGQEAATWGLDYAFRHAHIHRVMARTGTYSSQAMRFWTMLGFKEEGREREAIWKHFEWHDSVTYGILDREWAACRQNPQQRRLENSPENGHQNSHQNGHQNGM